MSKILPLQPDFTYHIYARGNNRENIFIHERNYAYFLKLYQTHFAPIADTYAYCLMRNHFHLLVMIKLVDQFKEIGIRIGPSQKFGNFLNAYAKSINNAYQRTGSLFQHPFGRIQVDTSDYFLNLVSYIHRNPEKHGFVTDFRDWPYSSYQPCLSNGSTLLKRDEVLERFGGRAGFREYHSQELSDIQVAPLIPDDD